MIFLHRFSIFLCSLWCLSSHLICANRFIFSHVPKLFVNFTFECIFAIVGRLYEFMMTSDLSEVSPIVDVNVMKTNKSQISPSNFTISSQCCFNRTTSGLSGFSSLHRPSLSPVMSVPRQVQDVHMHDAGLLLSPYLYSVHSSVMSFHTWPPIKSNVSLSCHSLRLSDIGAGSSCAFSIHFLTFSRVPKICFEKTHADFANNPAWEGISGRIGRTLSPSMWMDRGAGKINNQLCD